MSECTHANWTEIKLLLLSSQFFFFWSGSYFKPKHVKYQFNSFYNMSYDVLLNSCFPFFPHKAGIDVNVVMLQESQVDMNSSQQFCYKNVLIPKWYDIWTRIQVIGSPFSGHLSSLPGLEFCDPERTFFLLPSFCFLPSGVSTPLTLLKCLVPSLAWNLVCLSECKLLSCGSRSVLIL